mmetsp:Transcript_17124/g.42253  ORF Transcript_17124/g.42253 Transcript_17124/m.42253 type:complete len:215 (+) Transcript_17124:750-1394(+)
MTVVRILISVVRILRLTTPQEFGVLLPPILFSVEVLLVLVAVVLVVLLLVVVIVVLVVAALIVLVFVVLAVLVVVIIFFVLVVAVFLVAVLAVLVVRVILVVVEPPIAYFLVLLSLKLFLILLVLCNGGDRCRVKTPLMNAGTEPAEKETPPRRATTAAAAPCRVHVYWSVPWAHTRMKRGGTGCGDCGGGSVGGGGRDPGDPPASPPPSREPI